MMCEWEHSRSGQQKINLANQRRSFMFVVQFTASLIILQKLYPPRLHLVNFKYFANLRPFGWFNLCVYEMKDSVLQKTVQNCSPISLSLYLGTSLRLDHTKN
jgi:hypothetical protein